VGGEPEYVAKLTEQRHNRTLGSAIDRSAEGHNSVHRCIKHFFIILKIQ
jgi:hypothetical protein